jgi:hypothetical protein
MPAITTIKVRRSTASTWTSTNPTLASGEAGLESDTGKLKYGDGSTAWNSLSYFPSKISAKTQLTSPFEKTTIVGTAPTSSTINYDISAQTDLFYNVTAASAGVNGPLNFRWDSTTSLNSAMAVGDTVSPVFRVLNTTNTYRPSSFLIDGVSVTPKWQGGTAASAANTSSEDVYAFAITKTASATWTVYASQTQMK